MRGTYDTPKRDHVIKTRLDDDEYEFFLRKCKVYGMNQSEMIRASLDKLIINPVIKFSPVNKELPEKPKGVCKLEEAGCKFCFFLLYLLLSISFMILPCSPTLRRLS